MRLRKVSVDSPGLGRRRAGRGFVYLDHEGRRVEDPEILDRCKRLVIPPAWREVWICPDPAGHIQAVGLDDAGRRQYLYHEVWRARRERAKHRHVLEVAGRLADARAQVAEHLALPRLSRDQALAIAFRLLDRGAFRIGGETYAARHETYGLATLRKDHLRIRSDGTLTFEYTAKSGMPRSLSLQDEDLTAPLTTLRRRRGGGEELLAYRNGRGWADLTSSDVNAYIKDLLGPDASAKDFRTWRGTVLAAVTLARAQDVATARKRQAAVTTAVKRVAEDLGNTPAVSRASYIDPQVIDAFERGHTIPPDALTPGEAAVRTGLAPAEQAVLELLS
ncbi:DNA topoisomerase IB [Georgenia sp. 311]|uniref:DNA topoisomerase n=1 Tax=Georgenia wutianyii TaxID=2585135 RepID=A0ABX5VL66_9MICO|nr:MULTISPECIES: DNA topoisomerase IB [Georgenia]QDB78613.1 DNA topoisomerase IB [Georgenia wutianyii]TNC17655.1 DNA topoisomerase IB [Georgenia sp. 311]